MRIEVVTDKKQGGGGEKTRMKNFYHKPEELVWCPWCNGYHRRKWIQRHEFKSWTRLIAFHIALIPLGKV